MDSSVEAEVDVRKRAKRSRTNNFNFFPLVTVSREEDETLVFHSEQERVEKIPRGNWKPRRATIPRQLGGS